jgi:hypothetical protein
VLPRPRRYIPVMARLAEPERMVAFRVAWVDDKGVQQVHLEVDCLVGQHSCMIHGDRMDSCS